MKKNGIKKTAMHAPEFLNEPIDYDKSFSRGIKTVIGNAVFLFISGTASIDEKGDTFCPGDFLAQTKKTFDNLTALLKSEKATWHNVVQTRCYLKDMRDYGKFNELRNRFYKKHKLNPFPASVCIEADLCRPEFLVEIEAIAILKTRKR